MSTEALVDHCIREMKEMSNTFVKISPQEIIEARKSMQENKKGSDDGIEVQGIKILGPVALTALANIFTSYCLPSGMENHWTRITAWLIPKREGTSKVRELRPVACTSHLYKPFRITSRLDLGRLAVKEPPERKS